MIHQHVILLNINDSECLITALGFVQLLLCCTANLQRLKLACTMSELPCTQFSALRWVHQRGPVGVTYRQPLPDVSRVKPPVSIDGLGSLLWVM